MALINGNKFRKIIRRYSCENDAVSEVREYTLSNYTISDAIKVGRFLVTVTDNSNRWIFPKRKNRFFDVVFSYWGEGYTRVQGKMGVGSFGITFEAVEELTLKEYGIRKKELPMDETLRAAKSIINSTHNIISNG